MKFLLVLILAASFQVSAQDSENEIPEKTPDAAEVSGTEDEERLLLKLEEDRRKQGEAAVKLDQTRQNLQGQIESLPEQLKTLGTTAATEISLTDEKAVAALRQVLDQSHLYEQKPELIRKLIQEKVEGKPAGKLFERFPKLLDITVDILRDRDALTSLLGIFPRKEDLKIYGFVCLGLFILRLLIKRYAFPKKWGFLKRLGMGLILSLTLTLVSLGYFYHLFKKEVGPTVAIIGRHL